MDLLIILASFIFALGVLITFHELGHYLVARLCGVKVLRFSLGFGKPLYVRKAGKDQTEWAIAAFPLGGYVKMLDEREGEVAPHELSRAFNRQPVAKRMAIVAAGPIANFLLAILFYWALFIVGVPALKPYIADPAPKTLAASAGLRDGDFIRKLDGREVSSWQDLHWMLLANAVEQKTVNLEVEDVRGNLSIKRLDFSTLQGDDIEKNFFEIVGVRPYEPRRPPIVTEILPQSAAAEGGLMAGDEILSIDGQPMLSPRSVIDTVRVNPSKQLTFDVLRAGQLMKITLSLKAEDHKGKIVGRLGAGISVDPREIERLRTTVKYSVIDAVGQSLDKTWQTTVFTLKMMGKMVIGELSWKNISGPVTIADFAGKSAKQGPMPYIEFLALISISLGVLNLMPVPLLDGGHLMYYIAETIKGSPVSDYAMEIGSRIGFALLLGLMAFAFYNDINRLLTS